MNLMLMGCRSAEPEMKIGSLRILETFFLPFSYRYTMGGTLSAIESMQGAGDGARQGQHIPDAVRPAPPAPARDSRNDTRVYADAIAACRSKLEHAERALESLPGDAGALQLRLARSSSGVLSSVEAIATPSEVIISTAAASHRVSLETMSVQAEALTEVIRRCLPMPPVR